MTLMPWWYLIIFLFLGIGIGISAVGIFGSNREGDAYSKGYVDGMRRANELIVKKKEDGIDG